MVRPLSCCFHVVDLHFSNENETKNLLKVKVIVRGFPSYKINHAIKAL